MVLFNLLFILKGEAFYEARTLDIGKEVIGPTYIAYAFTYLLFVLGFDADIKMTKEILVCVIHFGMIPLQCSQFFVRKKAFFVGYLP